MPPPPIGKIMKLLVLSGTGNPNAHEREVAREKAETLMARHGITREQMRELYRQDHGLPPKPPPGTRPGPSRPRQGPPPEDPLEWERLQRELLAREAAAQEAAVKARLARAQAERQRAAREAGEKAELTARLRAAITQTINAHKDFADFIDGLASLGVQMVVPAENAVERLIYRWPPSKVAVTTADLGPGHDWPALLGAGIRLDTRNLRHREALSLLYLG